jgi:hypothetical protein
MRGKVLLAVRRAHLYLSVFFAPLLLLFVVTGWAQTMDFDHSTALMQKLSRIHTKQYFPTEAGPERKAVYTTITAIGGSAPNVGEVKGTKNTAQRATWPMKWLIATMCLALLTSITLGLLLAFTVVRNRAPVWIALIFGVITPVALLALAHT